MHALAATSHLVEIVLPASWTNHLDFEVDLLHELDSAPVVCNHENLINHSWTFRSQTFFTPPSMPIVEIPDVSGNINQAYHFFPMEDVALTVALLSISVLLLINSVAIIVLYRTSKYRDALLNGMQTQNVRPLPLPPKQ